MHSASLVMPRLAIHVLTVITVHPFLKRPLPLDVDVTRSLQHLSEDFPQPDSGDEPAMLGLPPAVAAQTTNE